MKYEVKGLLGQGGFGKVEKIIDEADGKHYALKTFCLSPAMSSARDFVEHAKKRFRKEAITQQGIKHPHVVPVISTDLATNPPTFIMPLALATMLNDMMDGTLNKDNFLPCFLDIMAGLEEIHSLGIYHRDLKPANVLRFKKKGEAVYAIGDFGLLSLSETGVTTITQTGMAKGTDMYTAPEITKDLHHASAQSDIYSLGCILHDFVGVSARIPCNEIIEVSEYGDVLSGATRFDATRRFKNVTSFRDALLSIKKAAVHPKTKIAETILDSLNDDLANFGDEEIDKLADFLSSQVTQNEKNIILDDITISHIEKIKKNSKSGSYIAKVYCQYARNSGFEFDFCDTVCGRVMEFMDGANIDVLIEGIFALLYMGTSHNRFYVERKAIRHFTGSIDDRLLKRMCIEIRIDGSKFCNAIHHLYDSINYSKSNLHLDIQKTIDDVCGK